MSDADKNKLIAALQKMHDTPQWQEALKKNGWSDAFITGDEFSTFLKDQDTRVASVLTQLGLA